jgi:hypothetical protein
MGCARRSGHFLAILGLLFGLCCPALANPIDPFAFTSLGAFPTAPGSYLVQTLDPVTPTLTEPDGTVLHGVYSSGLAVFDFDAILLGSGVLLSAGGRGLAPLVLLSRSDATIAGTIDVTGGGFPSGFHVGGDNGPGGGLVGAIAAFHGRILAVAGSSGGGFGGPGRDGGDVFVPPGAVTPGDPAIPVPGGRGGMAYGNITQQLVAGSGGAQGIGTGAIGPGSGGAGGGAIEIGAAGSLAISGAIVADGLAAIDNSGGGSGGAILLHAAVVDLTGRLEALGGAGGAGDPGRNVAAGGAGGGGQVAILYGRSYSGPGDVAVGNGSFITEQHSMPTPAALVLLGTGVLGVLGLAYGCNGRSWCRSR